MNILLYLVVDTLFGFVQLVSHHNSRDLDQSEYERILILMTNVVNAKKHPIKELEV